MPALYVFPSCLKTYLRIMMSALIVLGSINISVADVNDVIDTLPDNVKAAINETTEDCESVSYGKGAVERGTFVVDGNDYSYIVIDFENVKCGDNTIYFCGATGNCSHLVFIKSGTEDGEYTKVLDDSFIDVYFGSDHGRFTMTIQRHDTDCAGHEPGQSCLETRYWNGTTFDEPK